MWEKNPLQTPRSVKTEEERLFQAQERRLPAACGEDHGEAGHSPAIQTPPAAHGGPHARARARGHAQRRPWSRALAGPVAPWIEEHVLEQVFRQDL